MLFRSRYIKSSYAKAETEVQIDIGRKKLSAEVVKRPFYTNPEARKQQKSVICYPLSVNSPPVLGGVAQGAGVEIGRASCRERV